MRNLKYLKDLGSLYPRQVSSRDLGAMLSRKIWVNDPVIKEEISSYKFHIKVELKRRHDVAKAAKAAKKAALAARKLSASQQKAIKDGVKTIRQLFYELEKERERELTRSKVLDILSGKKEVRRTSKATNKVANLSLFSRESKNRQDYISWWKAALAAKENKNNYSYSQRKKSSTKEISSKYSPVRRRNNNRRYNPPMNIGQLLTNKGISLINLRRRI